MESSQFPVLARARTFARAFDRDVTFFHNVTPVSTFVADPIGGGASYAQVFQLQSEIAATRQAELRAFAGRHVESIVVRAGNTVEAILDFARARNADMIVVGHRTRSWFWRLLSRGLARDVIERSRRSVLVVPLARGS
jgi:nucleotide-binding universal stress UspA family protein